MNTKVDELYEACVNEQVDVMRGLNAEFKALQAEVQADLARGLIHLRWTGALAAVAAVLFLSTYYNLTCP